MRSTSPLLLSALLLGACAPAVLGPSAPAPVPAPPVGLPPVPRVDGPLEIRVAHPTPTTPKPNVDSTFVYGSVGTGAATLTIDGTPVPVAPNGAFLAYLPLPASGGYTLVAQARGETATATRSYQAPPAPAPAPAAVPAPTTVDFPAARVGTITGGADTLATGSDVAVGRPTPTGTYRWFLPRGARVAVTGQRGEQYRVRLDSATTAWFPAGAVALGDSLPAAPPAALAPPTLAPAAGWVDVRLAAGGAPFLVQPERDRLRLTLYGRTAPAAAPGPTGDPLVRAITWQAGSAGAAVAEIALGQPLWGYKAFYAPNGDLVVRVRRPPAIDAAQPLRGRRILVDPGHPPAGAYGPTGLTEAEANLAIALRLAEQLRARGAEVILTRTDASPVGLTERVEQAVRSEAELLVSVHNNALAEGMNPFTRTGSSTYYFHPFAAELARALDREIVSATRIADLGALTGNLALVRPTWMPAALTESLFLLVPEQEAALRDPAFLDRLAAAHLRGIEAFLRGRAAT